MWGCPSSHLRVKLKINYAKYKRNKRRSKSSRRNFKG